MKLFAIIEEKNINKITHIYVDEKSKALSLYAFSIVDNVLVPMGETAINCFKMFILGPHRENCASVDGYTVILDRDTGLYHYFKEGIEDFIAFCEHNGSSRELASPNYKPYRGKRKEKIKKYVFSISLATFLCLDITLLAIIISNITVAVIQLQGEIVDLNDGIAYILNIDEKNKFSDPIELEDIRDYIYNKSNIHSGIVKDFLWNPELIRDILPCYRGNYLDIVSRIRHLGLNIQGYTEEEKEELDTSGRYRWDHNLHVRDYDEENFDVKSPTAKTTAHEYAHLLETYSSYPFIKEVVAELVAHEYFFDSAQSEDGYSYSEACKYVRILMEIIGPEPVWDNAFRQNSTLLDDSAQPYLTDDEFKDFVRIMNYSPYYDVEVLKEELPRLKELLNILCLNKNGYELKSDGMIEAILEGNAYSRVYFRKSLMEKREDHYISTSISFEEALDRGWLIVYLQERITKEEYLDDWSPFAMHVRIDIHTEYQNVYVKYKRGEPYGYIVLKSGRILNIRDALDAGLVEVVYTASTGMIDVDKETFLENPNDPDYEFVPLIKCTVDTEKKKLILPGKRLIAIDTIDKKFASKQLIL